MQTFANRFFVSWVYLSLPHCYETAFGTKSLQIVRYNILLLGENKKYKNSLMGYGRENDKHDEVPKLDHIEFQWKPEAQVQFGNWFQN